MDVIDTWRQKLLISITSFTTPKCATFIYFIGLFVLFSPFLLFPNASALAFFNKHFLEYRFVVGLSEHATEINLVS